MGLHISGIPSISRALVSNKNDQKDQFVIFAEGTGFGSIMKIPGVDETKSYSNHILEIEEHLGIEAARKSIIKQVLETMKGHGVNVNERHVNMLA